MAQPAESAVLTVESALNELQAHSNMFFYRLLVFVTVLEVAWGATVITPLFQKESLHKSFPFEKWQEGFLSSTIFLGWIFGASVCATLSDRLGRLLFLRLSVGVHVFFGLAEAFAWTVELVLLCNVGVGFGLGGFSAVGFMLMLELCSTDKRSFFGGFGAAQFDLGIITLALASLVVQSWQGLSIVRLCLALSLFLGSYLLPESPHFFHVNGRVEETRASLDTVAKICNQEKKTEDFEIAPATHATMAPVKFTLVRLADSLGQVTDLFSTHLVRRTLCFMVMWFSVVMVYYGITFSAGDVFGGMVQNVLLFSLAEYPIQWPLTSWLMTKFGRRATIVGGFFASGVCCVGSAVLPGLTQQILANAGRCLSAVSFSTLWVMTTESFPTELRGAALAVSNSSARTAGLIAPLLASSLSLGVRMGVMTGMCVLAGCVGLLLHDTSDLPLPEEERDVTSPKGYETL